MKAKGGRKMKDDTQLLEMAFAFHGHRCPAMPTGFRMAREMMRRLGVERERDSGLLALVETGDNHFAGCFADGVMAATGCTFGKGNIRKLGYGKFALTLYDPRQGKGIRGVIRTESLRTNMKTDFFTKYRSKGVPASKVPAEVADPLVNKSLQAPIEKICDIGRPEEMTVESAAHVFAAVPCENCGEMVVESYARVKEGKTLCTPCSGYGRIAG